MGWINRKVLNEALATHGIPKLFNTDQGTQSTSTEWSGRLIDADIRPVMDGKGRWVDNMFIEWLWCLLQYACGYLNAFKHLRTATEGVGRWITHHNGKWLPRTSLSACTGSARVSRPLALAV